MLARRGGSPLPPPPPPSVSALRECASRLPVHPLQSGPLGAWRRAPPSNSPAVAGGDPSRGRVGKGKGCRPWGGSAERGAACRTASEPPPPPVKNHHSKRKREPHYP